MAILLTLLARISSVCDAARSGAMADAGNLDKVDRGITFWRCPQNW